VADIVSLIPSPGFAIHGSLVGGVLPNNSSMATWLVIDDSGDAAQREDVVVVEVAAP
jgi:hypothetical protein